MSTTGYAPSAYHWADRIARRYVMRDRGVPGPEYYDDCAKRHRSAGAAYICGAARMRNLLHVRHDQTAEDVVPLAEARMEVYQR